MTEDQNQDWVAMLVGGPLNETVQRMTGPTRTIIEGPIRNREGKRLFVTYEFSRLDAEDRHVFEFGDAIDLATPEGKGLLAILNFYQEPDYSIYTVQPGHHKEAAIAANGRRASVDEGIVDLILAIWDRGWHTNSSCQEWPEGRMHAGMGYVAFPVKRQGERFVSELRKAGIDCIPIEKKLEASRKDKDGNVLETIDYPALHVLLKPTDFERIVATLRSGQRSAKPIGNSEV